MMSKVRRCVQCGLPLTIERKTSGYPESGLDNVQLIGVNVGVCANGHEEVDIPAPDQLHALLADMIIRKEAPLNGSEIRFLRKEIGWNAKEFARRIGISPVHISRMETGERPIRKPMNQLIRLLCACTLVARNTSRLSAKDVLASLEQLEKVLVQLGSHRIEHVEVDEPGFSEPIHQWHPAA